MTFVGRINELEYLKDTAFQKEASMVAVLGRRRIGKSTLIKHFASIQKIPLYEFQGLAPRPGLTAQDQLKHFAQTLAFFLEVKSLEFADWSQALGALNQLSLKKKSIILLDEISWMGGSDPDFAGKLKEQWDIKLSQNKKIILILCGSVSSWIQKNILSGTGFAGRVSLEINLPELSIFESYQLLLKKRKTLTIKEIAQILSITGGVPRYLEEFNLKETIENNIKFLCFNESGFLFSEFDKIFAEVFGKKHQKYQKILLGLQDGAREPKEIAEFIDIPINGDFTNSLLDLSLGGFIKRDYSWNFKGQEARLSLIRISDNYTRFYLKYILPKKSRIKKRAIYKNESLDLLNWSTIFGFQFENLIQNNSHQLIDILKIPPSEIIQLGPCFQKGTKNKKGVKIDYLVLCKHNILHLIEIKSGNRLSIDIIAEVKDKMKRLKMPKGFSIRCHLIYLGELSESIVEEDFFDKIISFEEFLGKCSV